jgi:hypothetical protein
MLFYASFFNYKNIVLYLMFKGGNPFIINSKNVSTFHVIADKGNLNALLMIFNFEYFKKREELLENIKMKLKECSMKASYVKGGENRSPDKHQIQVRENFERFMSYIRQFYETYLSDVSLSVNDDASY